MANAQAKKLSLALYLNPVTSDADREAMEALVDWYEKAKSSFGEDEEAALDAATRVFHHDVYLAGLHLHLINPRLCRQVAEALAQKDLSMGGLVRQLEASGLWRDADSDLSFSELQLEQIRTAVAPPLNQPLDKTTATLVKQLDEQGEQITAVLVELQHLRRLTEKQAEQLRRARETSDSAPEAESPEVAGEPSNVSDEISISDMGSKIEQIKKVREKGVF